MTSLRNTIFAFCISLLVAGCGTLPASGPYGNKVSSGAAVVVSEEQADESAADDFSYVLVEMSQNIADAMATMGKQYQVPLGWPANSGNGKIRIAVGDTLQVTIYEIDSGGLFIPSEAGVRPGNFVTIPSQIVDKDGVIDVPYAGTISVVGRTPSSIADEITEKLGARAKEPQVVVSITERTGSQVSVIGDVNEATRFSLNLNGEKILDAIARAQGPSFPGYETLVSLQRSGQEWTIPFDLLVAAPEYNIALKPDDTIYLVREPEMFQMFGAAGFNGAIPFAKQNITLAEAIGQAGGLLDGQADPAEIYIYRLETTENLDVLGVEEAMPEDEKVEGQVPTIYKVNLRDPKGFFMAQKFPVRNKDVLYIANAESVELLKFLNLLNTSSVTKINTQSAVQQEKQ